MTAETGRKQRAEYRWTPARIALAMAIVLAAGSFIGVVLSREIGAIREGMASDARDQEWLFNPKT